MWRDLIGLSALQTGGHARRSIPNSLLLAATRR